MAGPILVKALNAKMAELSETLKACAGASIESADVLRGTLRTGCSSFHGIIKKQTAEAVEVSGGTNTSKGIMEAVAGALSTAK